MKTVPIPKANKKSLFLNEHVFYEIIFAHSLDDETKSI
jgi:hypothetical protein